MNMIFNGTAIATTIATTSERKNRSHTYSTPYGTHTFSNSSLEWKSVYFRTRCRSVDYSIHLTTTIITTISQSARICQLISYEHYRRQYLKERSPIFPRIYSTLSAVQTFVSNVSEHFFLFVFLFKSKVFFLFKWFRVYLFRASGFVEILYVSLLESKTWNLALKIIVLLIL